MELKGKSTLVTGGAGFIGSHLVDALLAKGCRVRVLDNLVNGRLENISHHQENSQFEFIQGSVTDPLDVVQAVKNIQIIFHLACLGVRHSIKHPFTNHRVNAEGTLLLLQYSMDEKAEKFIYCSSSEVYGTATSVPMNEQHPTRPCTVYGGSKLAGEAYARSYYKAYRFPTVVIRPFNTYGSRSHHEGDAGEMIPKSIVRILNDKPILLFGNGLQTRDFTYVKDTARGLTMAAESDDTIGGTFNIGSDFEISIRELAEKICEITGKSHSQIEHLDGRPGDVLRLYANSSPFRKVTNWAPQQSFIEGLKETVEWFKSRPEGIGALLTQEQGENWK